MVEILHKTFLEKLDTHPRTFQSTVSQHYRVGLEKFAHKKEFNAHIIQNEKLMKFSKPTR